VGIRGTRNCRDAFRALTIVAAAASVGLCAPAYAADTNVTVNAAVVRPNTLIKTDDLDFGTLISGPTGGTVSINAVTGARSTAGGVTPVGAGTQRAIFQGTGGILLITVSGSTSVTLARAGGGAAPMTATLIRAASTSGGGIALLGGTLLPSGVQTYYIGGTLTVPANQPEGDYSGTFTLTVNYL
jgi:predicted lipoprotein with Yx(FWY)xxD motif